MRMKLGFVVMAVLATALTASAGDQHFYEKGKLMQMDSVTCGLDENSGNKLSGMVLGTDSARKKTKEMLCQEYLLKSDRVIYRIRPRDDKHPVLLPVGETAEFRMKKDRMVLRVVELDGKEREYQVVSMTPVSTDDNTRTASAK